MSIIRALFYFYFIVSSWNKFELKFFNIFVFE